MLSRLSTVVKAIRKPKARLELVKADDLPIEIIQEILEKFDDGVRNSALRACCLVSQQWKALAQPLLYQTITLRSPSKFRGLLEALQSSPHLAAGVTRVVLLGTTYPLWNFWVYDEYYADLGAQILRLLSPKALELRVQVTSQELVHWDRYDRLKPPIREAITALLASPHLLDLTIDGWKFAIPVYEYYSLILASPSLKRLVLRRAFCEVSMRPTDHVAHSDSAPSTTVDLEYLELDIDGEAGNADMSFPPLPVTSSKGLRFHLTLKDFHDAVRPVEHRLRTALAPAVSHLELDVKGEWRIAQYLLLLLRCSRV
ncbi:hypothetical protein CC2G_009598 [Coprinopsis cinerea AmutBmut pab1-1]|nr:hypothetical protein CC2G_009598 [Coprinopsis cinerea AmutBmut pab1-1]